MSESNTAVSRALPLWPYSASDNVNRARNSEPGKMAVNLCMSFVDYAWRFATVPAGEIGMRLYQNMAHGGAPAFTMHGTPDQEDRTGARRRAARLRVAQRHQDLYVGQESAARVLLLGRPLERLPRLLPPPRGRHIPFAVSDNLNWIGKREFDLVIAPDGVPDDLERWVREGGRLLAAGTETARLRRRQAGAPLAAYAVGLLPRPRPLALPQPHRHGPPAARWRIRGDGAGARPALTLIPPARFGPPEMVWTDKVETDKPGLILSDAGAGRLAYLPWDLGALYHRLSSRRMRRWSAT